MGFNAQGGVTPDLVCRIPALRSNHKGYDRPELRNEGREEGGHSQLVRARDVEDVESGAERLGVGMGDTHSRVGDVREVSSDQDLADVIAGHGEC